MIPSDQTTAIENIERLLDQCSPDLEEVVGLCCARGTFCPNFFSWQYVRELLKQKGHPEAANWDQQRQQKFIDWFASGDKPEEIAQMLHEDWLPEFLAD